MSATRKPGAPARLRTWLVTGPLGHLYGALADLAELLARVALARVRGR